MTKIRKRIAQNLVQAQQTAAILTTFACEAWLRYRARAAVR